MMSDYNEALKDSLIHVGISPKIKGVKIGMERLVIGSDGSVWYTNTHYETFIQIKQGSVI